MTPEREPETFDEAYDLLVAERTARQTAEASEAEACRQWEHRDRLLDAERTAHAATREKVEQWSQAALHFDSLPGMLKYCPDHKTITLPFMDVRACCWQARAERAERERDEARNQQNANEGTIGAVIDIIGGIVEGRPTARINFLQRLRELLRAEAALAATRRDADRIADEVAVLVRNGVIGARTPAADALLDYREPPSTLRADRLAVLEAALAATRAALERIRDETKGAFSAAFKADPPGDGIWTIVDDIREIAAAVLLAPDPGAPYRAVVEAARHYMQVIGRHASTSEVLMAEHRLATALGATPATP